jgi:uncharacterized protein YchJ
VLSGATSSPYDFGASSAAQNGQLLRAKFTNSAGSVTTNAALLTVDYAPSITTQPKALTLKAGEAITFSAAASGNPAPSLQWEISFNSGSSWSVLTGATSSPYNFGAAVAAQNGALFRAKFTNSVASTTTSTALLTVDFAPSITTQPASQTVKLGASATFTAAASGNPSPTVQWQQSTNAGKTWTSISGATSASYKISATTLAENGYEYRAVFTNSLGSATSSAAKLTD